ncbi:hypothetical protein Sya03_49580 [Spirilliplanes yamanashiensis]|uniref:Uncharacterized protein n=1 Tax=Spirilliplanes yamanashiensis TaxID=42233 RepID=A0A8J4DL40_9ACTN|nr:hypothetical protein Sya03_49580 [Spirilliplanes yamanashiensis]
MGAPARADRARPADMPDGAVFLANFKQVGFTGVTIEIGMRAVTELSCELEVNVADDQRVMREKH